MEENTSEEKTTTTQEEFKVNGEDLVRRVKEIIKQGNIRKIIIKNKEGKSILEIPLTLGVVGALLVPTAAAVGAVAALVTECSIVVIKDKE